MAGLPFAMGAASIPRPADLTVELTGLRNDRGMIRACLTSNRAHFPQCAKDPAAMKVSVAAQQHRLTFSGVAPGTYALSVLADENGNGQMDKAAMIPREGFGFSRNAPVRFGPPSFSAVAFHVTDQPVTLNVQIRYIL